METGRTYGAGHDFSPKGRKILWGISQPIDILPLSENTNTEDLSELKPEKNNNNHDLPETNNNDSPQVRSLIYIFKPKCRNGQKMVKATGDYKPPHGRINRIKSYFVTLDLTGNKVSYYKYKPKSLSHPRLPSYIRTEEMSVSKIKRCTLHSYLRCDDYTVDKKNCTVCHWFKEKQRNEDL